MESGVKVRAPEAADWALSRGISAITSAELSNLLGVPLDQVRRRLHAPAQRGEWVMPVRGLWVPVPPEYRAWGAPPGIEVIDAMMKHLDAHYYVGWLTAASLHGAAHHAPQVFQVAADRQIRDRTVGRTRLEFVQREVDKVATVAHATRSGRAWISTVAATALDLASDVVRSGGIDNVATILIELAELDAFQTTDIIALTPLFPAAAGRRIGYVLEQFTDHEDLEPLRDAVRGTVASPSRLDPAGIARGPVDHGWMLYLNRDLDPDT